MKQLTLWWIRVVRVTQYFIPGMVVCILLLHGVPAAAQEDSAVQPAPAAAQESSAAQPAMEAQAKMMLTRMADFLSKAQSFSTTVDVGFDVVQDSGQKIEFGETRKITIRRPDHVRIETTKRDGSVGGFFFDGKEIAVFNVQDKVYATVPKPGTLDAAFDYFTNDLDMRLPLAELLSSDFPKLLQERVREVDYVEQEAIAGVPCDHLALRGDRVDMQMWIAKGEQPLPHRLIITYTLAEGQPQFWAQFSQWNLAPEVPDSLFAFTPAAGAVKIAFMPPAVQPGGDTGGDDTEGEDDTKGE
jgi:hypothetical protein